MALSESMKIGDDLRRMLAEAQKVVSETDIRGKIKLDVEAGGTGSAVGVDSAMDRTAKDARSAAEASFSVSGEGGGPLSATDRLLDAFQKLIRSMEGLPDQIGKLGGRRRRAAPGEPPEEEGGGGLGYTSPYVLQSLINNPIGTSRSALMSMLSGGAGMGLKGGGIQSGLDSFLGGSGGTFNLGKALGSEVGLGAGTAGEFMGAGAMGATGAAVLGASFLATMKLQEHFADGAMRDVNRYVEDARFGRGAGFNWRQGAWGNEFRSRKDVDQEDIKAIMASSGIGYSGMTRNMGGAAYGDWNAVGFMQNAANSALRIGASPSEMGGLIGAATRSGTINPNVAEGPNQMLHFLGMIEKYTAETAEHGLSTAEGLANLSGMMRRQSSAMGGVVTMGAAEGMTAMDLAIRRAMPAGTDRAVPESIEDWMSARPSSAMQSTQLLNQVMGDPSMMVRAESAMDPTQLSAIKKNWGPMANMRIAQEYVNSPAGAAVARTMLARSYRSAGVNPAQIEMLLGSPTASSAAAVTAMTDTGVDGDILDAGAMQRAPSGGGPSAKPAGMSDIQWQEVLRARTAGQVQTTESGLTAATAAAMKEFSNNMSYASSEAVRFGDNLRNSSTLLDLATLSLGGPLIAHQLGNRNARH